MRVDPEEAPCVVPNNPPEAGWNSKTLKNSRWPGAELLSSYARQPGTALLGRA
jgi:hypothetical protein